MDNPLVSNPLYFWKIYELLSSSKNYSVKKIKNDVCRYCGRNYPEVTFEQDTHLLPELLGGNDILTYDECDSCNKIFGGYESNLSIFIRPYVTLIGIKGKHGVPSFQSRTINRDEYTRTTFKHTRDGRRELIITNQNDYRINYASKTFELLFRKPPFRPISVYKALTKIGLSLLPDEYLAFNRRIFDWLVNKIDDIPFFNCGFVTTLNRSYFREPRAELYRAKKLFTATSEFPEYTLVLYFANQVMQIFLPFSDELLIVNDGKRTLELNLYPGFAVDKQNFPSKIEIKYFNLGITHTVTEDQKISFTYQNAELKIPQGKLQ